MIHDISFVAVYGANQPYTGRTVIKEAVTKSSRTTECLEYLLENITSTISQN